MCSLVLHRDRAHLSPRRSQPRHPLLQGVRAVLLLCLLGGAGCAASGRTAPGAGPLRPAEPAVPTRSDPATVAAPLPVVAPPAPPAVGSTSDFRARIAAAVRRSPAVDAAQARRREAAAAVTEARSALLPQVSAGFDANTSEGQQAGVPATVPRGRWDNPRFDLVAQASQLVFDGGAALDRLAAARTRTEQSAAEAEAAASATALQAVSAYVGVHRARRLLEQAEDNSLQHERLERQILARADGGVGVESDALRASSRSADARAQVAEARGELQRAAAVFVQLFGEPPGELGAPERAGQAAAAGADADHNPQLRALRLAFEAARAELSGAEAAYWPTLRLSVAGTRYDAPGGSRAVDDVTVRLGTRVELFNGFATAARQAGAAERVQRAVADERRLREEIERTVATGRAMLVARQARLAALDGSIRSSRAARVAFLDGFATGRRQFTELLDVQRDLNAALVARIATEADLVLEEYSLLAIAGRLLSHLGGETGRPGAHAARP